MVERVGLSVIPGIFHTTKRSESRGKKKQAPNQINTIINI
jgi:hypothetical protein